MELTIFKRYLTRFLKENGIMTYRKQIFTRLFQETPYDKSKYCGPFARIRWNRAGGVEFWLLMQIAWLDYLTFIIHDGEMMKEFDIQKRCNRLLFVKNIKLYTNALSGVNKIEEVEKAYRKLYEKTCNL